VIVQAEHIQAVNNIEPILAVEGVDAVLVGPYDLSASMDHMGQVEHPDVQAAIQRVRQACQAHGMPLGIFAATAERARAYIQEGYRLVAAGGDTLMLGSAARDMLGKLRS
jgi:2-keto-3-deoxy-L-rhamnonate aldolase RhmA